MTSRKIEATVLLSLVMAKACDCAVVDQDTAVPITSAIAVFYRK
jgi:hypothetical protein